MLIHLLVISLVLLLHLFVHLLLLMLLHLLLRHLLLPPITPHNLVFPNQKNHHYFNLLPTILLQLSPPTIKMNYFSSLTFSSFTSHISIIPSLPLTSHFPLVSYFDHIPSYIDTSITISFIHPTTSTYQFNFFSLNIPSIHFCFIPISFSSNIFPHALTFSHHIFGIHLLSLHI